MQHIIDIIGYGLCHQLPSRSFFAGGLYYPVCARDTGIYFGLVTTIAVLFVLYRRRDDAGFYSIPVLAGLACLVVPLAIDGGTSYLGLRETTNTIRFLTGCGTGVACGALLFWALRALGSKREESVRLLSRPVDVCSLIFAELFLSLAFLWGFPHLGAAGAVFSALCILATIALVNGIALSLAKPFRGKLSQKSRLFALWIASFGAACVELAILCLFKSQVLSAIL